MIYTQFQQLKFKMFSKAMVYNIFFSIFKDFSSMEIITNSINGIGRQTGK